MRLFFYQEPNVERFNEDLDTYDAFLAVSFGLEGKMSTKEIKEPVVDTREQVRLQGYEHRYPSDLSGGHQQRVAVARMLTA